MKKHVLIIAMALVSVYSQAQTLSFSLNVDTVFVNDAVTATNTSTGFPSGTLFIWNFGDSCVNLPTSNPAEVIPAGGAICNDTISGLGNAVYYYRGAGEYTVTLNCYDTLNNCNSSFTQTIVVRNHPYSPQGVPCELVINGSFEDYDNIFCPMNFSTTNFLGAGAYSTAHTGALFNWSYPNGASPDFFVNDPNCPPIAPSSPVNNFAGCETAHTGNGYVGMQTYSLPSIPDTIPSYREYVQGELAQPLQAGRTYFLSLWVSSADYLRHISRIQVGFYTVPVNVNTGLNLALPNANNVIFFDNVVPINQPAYGVNGWTNFTSTYTATGGEHTFIVGNYFYDVNPSFPILSSNGIQIQIGNYNYCSGQQHLIFDYGYIYLDDVSLYGIEADAVITHACMGNNGAIDITQVCGIGQITYQWSNGATTEDISALAPGVYTVTITDANGAQSSFEYTINAVFPPSPPSITGPISPCVNGPLGTQLTYSIIDPEAGVTYTWNVPGGSPSTGTGTSFVTSFSSNGSYTITVTASNGCTSTGTFEIYPCCEPSAGGDDISNTAVSNIFNDLQNNPGAYNYGQISGNFVLFTAGYSHSGGANPATPDFTAPVDITINGTLIVDYPLVFHNCRISMGPDAKIILRPNTFLWFELALITSCGEYMWNYIIESDISNVVRMNAVRMEDAQNGVISEQGADLQIVGNYFNKNRYSIKMHDYAGAHPADISINHFNCIDQSGNADVLLPPFQNDYALTGIEGANVDNIAISQIAAGYTNYFKNMTYGIYLSNCNAFIMNNDIQFMQPFNNHCTDCGTGIYATAWGNPQRTVMIGVASIANSENHFSDSRFGIVLSRDVHSRIESNTFVNMEQAGINIHDNRDHHAVIFQNTFEYFHTGITVTNPMGSQSTYQINENSFNNSGYNETGSSFYSTAITFQNIIGRPKVRMYRNDITDCRIGIHAANVNKPALCIGIDLGDDPAGNTITYNQGDGSNIMDEHIGIWIQSCNTARIVDNTITNDLEADPNSLFKGIDAERSRDCRINCNTITNLSYSMRFLSDCDFTLLRANEMTGYDKAIWLDGATLPDQFQYDNTWGVKQPLDNIWNDPATGNGQPTDRVDGTLSSGINPINWYYRNNVNPPSPFNPLDGGMISFIITTVPINPGLVECDDYTNRESREEKFGETVRDNLEFDEYETELIYQAKMDAYKAMAEDNSLIYQNDTADYIFGQFYQAMEQSNIGLFAQVEELVVDTAGLYTASGINEAIVDTNAIEYYLKTVNDLYLNKYIQGIPLSSVDTMILENTALSNIFTTGEALHVAAAMLNMEVHPSYSAMRKAKKDKRKKSIEVNADEVAIVPNPATTYFRIKGNDDIDVIEIISVEGKELKRYDKTDGQEFSMEGLVNGIYIIKLTRKNGEVTYHKLNKQDR